MDFELSLEQRMLRDTARQLAESVKWDELSDLEYPRAFAHAIADAGMTGIMMHPDDGGQGASLIEALVVMEAATMVHPRAGDVLQVTNFGAIRQIAELATPGAKERFMTPVLAGDAVTSIGITEPESGSAVAEMKTTARIEGDEVVVTGSKIFNTHGPYADHYVVWSRFAPGPDGIGSVIVPASTPGFSRGAVERHLSGEVHCALYFDGCRVPLDNILIQEGGLRRLLPVFNVERLGNAARSLACGERAFADAVTHVKNRKQFGRPLGDNQGLRWRFADMRIKLDAARLLLYRAANTSDGIPDASHSAIAKLACNTAGFEVVNEAIQMHGALGLSDQTILPYLLGRTRGWMIAGGTLEMMRNGIAQKVLGKVTKPD